MRSFIGREGWILQPFKCINQWLNKQKAVAYAHDFYLFLLEKNIGFQ